MKTYIVQVGTNNKQDGFCREHFDALNDDVRSWIKARAAEFRRFQPERKCTAIIMRNGGSLSEARYLDC